MKNKILLFTMFIFSSFSSFAQWRELGGTLSVRLTCSITSPPVIYAMVMDDSGNVYAAGAFTNASGEFYVVKYDKATKTWSEVGSAASGGGPLKANYSIDNLLIDHNGNLYASGSFTNMLGETYIAKWDKATNVWSALGSQKAGDMVIDKSNNIYVSASDSVAGELIDYIAKWDGASWSMYGPPLKSAGLFPIIKLVQDDLGRIYTYNKGYIFVNDGTRWTDTIFTGGGGVGPDITAMAIDPDRNVYLGSAGNDITNSVFKLDLHTKTINELCTTVPTFPMYRSCYISAIAAVSSSEVYVGGGNLYDEMPYMQIVKWSKVTNTWTKVGNDTDIITGGVNTIIIDTQSKNNNILIGGRLYNSSLGILNTDQFVGEYKQQCNAYFTLLPSSAPHTYTLTNYCYGTGKVSYKWNWGDGSAIDTGALPSHVYARAGVYQICVEITDSLGCSSSYCSPANSYLAKTTADMVFVNVVKGKPTEIKNVIQNENTIIEFPNPANSTIQLVGKSNDRTLSLELIDVLGNVLLSKSISINNNEINTSIDVNNLSSGTYFIKLKSENRVENIKFFKQ